MSSNKELIPLQKNIFYHEAALFVRQFFLGLNKICILWVPLWNKRCIASHYFKFPSPTEILATGGLIYKEKGITWPSGAQGNPPLHVAVCDECACVKELWIIDLIKLQMLKIQCLWRVKWLVFKQNIQKILHQHFQQQKYHWPQPRPPPKFKQKLLVHQHHLVFLFHCLGKYILFSISGNFSNTNRNYKHIGMAW